MYNKISNLKNTLAYLGYFKEATEIGFFVIAQEIYIVEQGVRVSDIYKNDLKFKNEIEKINPNLNWNKLQIGQKILIPSYEDFKNKTYPNKGMIPSNNASELIKQYEGLRLNSYDDGFGNITIGYGHLILPEESLNSISEEKANQLLIKDINIAAKAITDLVKVKLNQNQFDALTSFVFNLGRGTFSSSKLLELLNQGDFKSAAIEMLKFNKVGSVEISHLTKRRKAEQELFLG